MKPSGMVMSQNIRAEGVVAELVAQGSTWKVDGSGAPPIPRPAQSPDRDPSKPMPFLEGAPSSSAGAMYEPPEDQHVQNHSRTKGALFQVRRTNFLLSVHTSNSMHRLLKPCYRCPARSAPGGPQGVRGEFRARTAEPAGGKVLSRNIAHHRRVHTLVATNTASVLGAVEGDHGAPSWRAVPPRLIRRPGRGWTPRRPASPGAAASTLPALATARTDGADPVNRRSWANEATDGSVGRGHPGR